MNNTINQTHLEISVNVPQLWAEYVTAILLEKFNCSGVVTQELQVKDEQIINESNCVKGYLWIDEKNPLSLEHVRKVFYNERILLLNSQNISSEELGSWDVSFKKIPSQDWDANWKKHWKPQKIGNKIVICPSWEDYTPNENEIIINLDPGTAFGTGTHPTTRLCMVALENYIKGSEEIADIGMGSGILAISAIKLGAKSAEGVDNDTSVIEVANENAKINNCLEKCNFYHGSSADVKGTYDIVVANILANVLINMMDELKRLMKPRAKLILSGINSEKSQEVQNSVKKTGMQVVEILKQEDWIAIIATK
ncbi:MAG: 50S ribosomal protein L11 methyltransferase [Candidatus Gastranaerophilales bacterium]|nr:50S ribosomal protein L11 methyltransferase [Candidatus Gastranaerophilales bacterium]